MWKPAVLLVGLTASLVGLMAPAGWAEQANQRAMGFTEPNRTIQVAFSQPGRLQQVHVCEGHTVGAGELLAQLEDSELEVALAIAEVRAQDRSEIAAAQAESSAVQARLEDLKRLLDSGAASSDEIQRVTTEAKVAEAKLETARAEQQIQELEVKRLETLRELRRLVSPTDGYIKQVHKHEGEYVSTADPQVIELVQLDPLKVTFHLTHASLQELEAGRSVTLYFPQLRKSADAILRRISPLVDPESGTTEVEAELPNPSLEFQAGLQCELRLVPPTMHADREHSND